MLSVEWNIETIDRTAMISDIVEEFIKYKIYIDTLQVSPCNIFVRFNISPDFELEKLLSDLLCLHDILSISPSKGDISEASLANCGHIIFTNQGVITQFNQIAEKQFSVSRNDIIGEHISSILIWEEISEFLLGNICRKDIQNRTNHSKINCTIRPVFQHKKLTGGIIFINDCTVNPTYNKILSPRLKNGQPRSGVDDIIYASANMSACLDTVRKIAKSKYAVLIRGETGTGKELIARAVHDASDRKDCAFEALNCAAIPESLVESELFGYEGGAFSGALKGGKMGLFESANNGTIFLDEFGELSLSLQSKLLRVLQDGMIKRVGGLTEKYVDVRVIAATNQNLEQLIEEKKFREDLYYRVNILPINIPPLRERPNDIIPLVDYFTNKYAGELNKEIMLLPCALDVLTNYSWPGNIRELKNVLLRSILLAEKAEISGLDISIPTEKNLTVSTCTNTNTADGNIKAMIETQEREMIKKSLISLGSARKVANEVGLSHTTVLNKIKLYDLEYLLSSKKKTAVA
ncbi:sigma-54 interaction domain-containing protein [Vibrio panuliri]|uniref:HTH-type transcriptional regulatory protein TyrR n=1 Tax=Vibrio panuliri TaxID=1381081 RepID=A0A1Q9HK74_9VIBR|nr:sigma 54-interacting transcriptional regulator [Vibrio panuliri]KAB1455486.1 AAA family ATPase [Vibrio panuliri]OLQ90724.1 RNA polymerase subunit sigma-54 [Vibrio panuliri]